MLDATLRLQNVTAEIEQTAREMAALWKASKNGLRGYAAREKYDELRNRMTELQEIAVELRRELNHDVRELEESYGGR
jgi:uncharacterized protein YukE